MKNIITIILLFFAFSNLFVSAGTLAIKNKSLTMLYIKWYHNGQWKKIKSRVILGKNILIKGLKKGDYVMISNLCILVAPINECNKYQIKKNILDYGKIEWRGSSCMTYDKMHTTGIDRIKKFQYIGLDGNCNN